MSLARTAAAVQTDGSFCMMVLYEGSGEIFLLHPRETKGEADDGLA